jgi:hypothetical protein
MASKISATEKKESLDQIVEIFDKNVESFDGSSRHSGARTAALLDKNGLSEYDLGILYGRSPVARQFRGPTCRSAYDSRSR